MSRQVSHPLEGGGRSFVSGSAKWDGPDKELVTKIRLIVGPVNSAG